MSVLFYAVFLTLEDNADSRTLVSISRKANHWKSKTWTNSARHCMPLDSIADLAET